jgi:hypothetical protein
MWPKPLLDVADLLWPLVNETKLDQHSRNSTILNLCFKSAFQTVCVAGDWALHQSLDFRSLRLITRTFAWRQTH